MFKKIFEVLSKPMNRAGFGIMGGFMIVWGAWIASPFWSALGSAEIFSVVLLHAPEWSVGLIALSIGASIIRYLVIGCFKRLQFVAGITMYFWALFSICCLVGDWQNPGWITYLVLALYSTFVYENIRINRRIEQSQ